MNLGSRCHWWWTTFILFWFSQSWKVTFKILELVFYDCIVPTDSNEIKLESSDQTPSPPEDENTRVVLEPYPAWKCHSTVFLDGVDVFKVHKCLLFMTDEFLLRFTKNCFKVKYIIHSQSTILIFASFFNLVKCLYYQKYVNQINLNHATLQRLTLPIFKVFALTSLNINLSFNETCDILALMETNFDGFTDSSVSLWGAIIL